MIKKIISTIFFVIAHISLLHTAEPLLQGGEEIKAKISQQQPQKIMLIIGVRPGEDQFHERFDHLIKNPDIFAIFADKYAAIEPLPGHFLQGNFNSKDDLQRVRDEFSNAFDLIITDGIDTAKLLPETAKHLDILYAILKQGGTLFFHDHLSLDFNEMGDTIKLSEEDFSHWKEILPAKLNNTFGKLPGFCLPFSLAHSIDVKGPELEKLTDNVMLLVHDYTPQRFIATANMLVKLGLKDSGLMGGGPQGGFIAKDKEGIRSRLISFLQKKQFIAMHISSMVDSARNVQKSFLKEIFKEAHVDVVSQESDQEILNILKPRAHGTEIIIYKIRKPD